MATSEQVPSLLTHWPGKVKAFWSSPSLFCFFSRKFIKVLGRWTVGLIICIIYTLCNFLIKFLKNFSRFQRIHFADKSWSISSNPSAFNFSGFGTPLASQPRK